MSTADGSLEVEWAGDRWRLHPDGTVERPDRETLLVADVHLGKGAAFRAGGLPVPRGGSEDDLRRLGHRLRATGCRRLVVLGDLFHAPSGRTPEVDRALVQWRRAHPAVELWWIRGNHDRFVGELPGPGPTGIVPEGREWGGVRLAHTPPARQAAPERRGAPGHPTPAQAPLPTLCGHLHPVVRLRDPRGGSLRAPCFWIRPDALVLPAFGSFTGGHGIVPRPGDRVALPGEGTVVEARLG